MNIQAKSVAKTTPGLLKITFDSPFDQIPIVALTPFWQGSQESVGGIPTVSEITREGCTIISKNAANNYFVNVLAIDPGTSTIGGNTIIADATLKVKSSIEFLFTPHFHSNDPVTILTSYWKKQNAAVGHIETLDDSSASEASVISSNAASNYFVNHISSNVGTIVNGKQVIQSNIVHKQNKGTIRVYFNQIYQTPPTVMLSPWWRDANSQVGHIETVTVVTNQYFDFASDNAANNYFVNWMAIGKV